MLRQASGFENAYSRLFKFDWEFDQHLSHLKADLFSEQLSEEWDEHECYLFEENNTLLTHKELETEYTRVERRLVAETNSHAFRTLFHHCYEFVTEAIDGDIRDVLNGLEELTGFSRRPPRLQKEIYGFFLAAGPEAKLLTSDLSTAISETGGEDVFAARLLLWCAAAHRPNEFQFPSNFKSRLMNAFFWYAVVRKSGIQAFPPLPKHRFSFNSELQSSLENILKFLKNPQFRIPAGATRRGFDDDGMFWWDGRSFRPKNQVKKILRALWPDRDISDSEFKRRVWDGPHEPPTDISSQLHRFGETMSAELGKFFGASESDGRVILRTP